MAIAVAHKEKDVVVIDAVRHRKPPFSPEDVVAEFSELLAVYRVTKVVGDRYAGEWPRERFRHRGIAYEASEKSKSDLYRDLLPLINSRPLDLLDAILGSWRNSPPWSGGPPAAAATLSTTPRGGHDDLANAVAGALALASTKVSWLDRWSPALEDAGDPDGARAWQAFRLMQHIQRYG